MAKSSSFQNIGDLIGELVYFAKGQLAVLAYYGNLVRELLCSFSEVIVDGKSLCFVQLNPAYNLQYKTQKPAL